MKKSLTLTALALAAVVAVRALAHAGIEQAPVTGDNALTVAFQKVIGAIAGKLSKLPGAPSKGLYGRDHCSPYDDTMEPAYESEVGYYCKSKKPASVTCQIIGWETVNEGEGGPVLRPILGECDPRGGWAGTPIDRNAPQSP